MTCNVSTTFEYPVSNPAATRETDWIDTSPYRNGAVHFKWTGTNGTFYVNVQGSDDGVNAGNFGGSKARPLITSLVADCQIFECKMFTTRYIRGVYTPVTNNAGTIDIDVYMRK